MTTTPQPRDFTDARADADAYAKMRLSDNPRVVRAGETMLFENNRHLTLQVVITDRELAQAALMSMYGDDDCLIPGMEITLIDPNPNDNHSRSEINTLRKLADQLEAELNNRGVDSN